MNSLAIYLITIFLSGVINLCETDDNPICLYDYVQAYSDANGLGVADEGGTWTKISTGSFDGSQLTDYNACVTFPCGELVILRYTVEGSCIGCDPKSVDIPFLKCCLIVEPVCTINN